MDRHQQPRIISYTPFLFEDAVDEDRRGRYAYEADIAVRPLYHDGKPRPSWDQLSEIARWSWTR